MEPTGVSVVIPALDEELSVGGVVEAVLREADEVIVVDGHSEDRTAEIAGSLGCKVLYDDRGKGSALRKGFAHASGGVVIMMDADGAHSAGEIAAVVGKVREGFDVCMPSRFMAGGGSDDITPLRVVGNDFYRFWIGLLWGVAYTDVCYGFRGFSREALDLLRLDADGFDIEAEIAIKTAKLGLKFAEIPSRERARVYGLGKLGFWTSLTIDRRVLLELLR
jgi:glycosyltransferase involved in cell wall biosynthesis